MKRIMLAAAIAATTVNPTFAAVYISHDSLQPSYEHKLANAQIDALKSLAESQQRNAETSQYMAKELIKYQYTQQELTDAKLENLATQSVMLDRQRRVQLQERNELVKQNGQLEAKRIAMLKESQQREQEFIQRQLQQSQSAYSQQDMRQRAFLEDQKKIQEQTLALQNRVQNSSDLLLANQLKKSAPSNLIVASKDASNLKQTLKPTDADQLGNLSPANQTAPVVNLNEFVKSILPAGWKYYPPKGLDSERINVVQGKDWQSILNHIAINNPHLELFIDPYAKTLKITNTLQYANTPMNKGDMFRTWHITTSRSLRGNLDEFAKSAKWDLIWDKNVPDYDIVAPAVLQTDFAGENGIVNTLIKTTMKKDKPLYAEWSPENNVVRITLLGAKK